MIDRSKVDTAVRASRCVLTVVSVVLLGLASWQPLAAQPVADEYKIKAAFLFHFAQLVDWPPGALNTADQSLQVCVFHDKAQGRQFESTLNGKIVGTRTVLVREVANAQGLQGCNVVFLGGEQDRRQAAILKELRGLPVLTVVETPDAMPDGGMIRFHLDENRVRFDIDLGSAESSHIKISSRLLLLASMVTGGDEMERER
jgi:hypothetical protein